MAMSSSLRHGRCICKKSQNGKKRGRLCLTVRRFSGVPPACVDVCPSSDDVVLWMERWLLVACPSDTARYSHMKPVEKCATWMAADWDGVCPDFNAYRDLHFLFRLGLEPARAFRVCNPTLPRLWYTTHVKPAFHVAYTNPEGDFTIMQLTYARHAFGTNPFIPMPPGCIKPLVAGTQIVPSLGHPARYLLNDDGEEAMPAQSGPSGSTGVGVDEDTVLVASKLETFDDCLSEEDAELLLSILSAPYLSIPLLLHYFSENRVSQIAHSRIQNLLESVLFEPKSIARSAAGMQLRFFCRSLLLTESPFALSSASHYTHECPYCLPHFLLCLLACLLA